MTSEAMSDDLSSMSAKKTMNCERSERCFILRPTARSTFQINILLGLNDGYLSLLATEY